MSSSNSEEEHQMLSDEAIESVPVLKDDKVKASDMFVKCLEAEGVEYIFGLPGEENADFVYSLKSSEQIKFILCRHEQAAAFMADVYGRLTGKPGVCLGTLGPGASNLVTGVADGNMDRAPMIVLTGQASTTRQHKESHQNMDVVAMFDPITKWATPIRNAESIPEVIRKAFKLATTEKPGACHIELAENIAGSHMDILTPLKPSKVRRPGCDDKIADIAWSHILQSEHPVIISGNGCVRKRASNQLREFVAKTGIPVINTFMGKGAVDMDSEQCMFTVGLQSHDFNNFLIDQSDCVITIGYDLVEYHPRLWNPEGDKKIIHIDFLPAEVDSQYQVEVEIVSDLAHALWALNERADRDAKDLSWDFSVAKEVREKFLADFEEYKDDDTDLIKPQKVLYDVRKVLGNDDILISDVGAHKMWIARYYQCHEPNTCLISNGFCSMGVYIGSVAAKLIYPEKRVLAIAGDGGFLMNVQDMETAARYGINVVVMVWRDGGYGLIEWKQNNHFGDHTNLSFNNPDFLKLAAAFDWAGYEVKNSSDLEGTLEEAFECGKPALVVCDIDYNENPKLTKRLGAIRIAI